MSDEEFTAFATAAAPCFQKYVDDGTISAFELPTSCPGRIASKAGTGTPSATRTTPVVFRLCDGIVAFRYRLLRSRPHPDASSSTAPNETCTTPALSMTAIAG